MSAQIVPLRAAPMRTPLAQHLNGHHAQGPAPGSMIGRMQSESAVRAYVRRMSARYPLGDSAEHDDVWQQVEDILALVPMLASSVEELDDLAHATRRTITARGPGRISTMTAELASCRIEIVTTGDVLRLRLFDPTEVRIIGVRLHACGAKRTDDHMAAT